MSFNDILDAYSREVTGWLEQEKKALAAVQKLQKAVANGNSRDIEKLRVAAGAASAAAHQCAEACPPLLFDAAAYLTPEGEFIPELRAAAERAGVRLSVRDGLIFCYPVLVQMEPNWPPCASKSGWRITSGPKCWSPN